MRFLVRNMHRYNMGIVDYAVPKTHATFMSNFEGGAEPLSPPEMHAAVGAHLIFSEFVFSLNTYRSS